MKIESFNVCKQHSNSFATRVHWILFDFIVKCGKQNGRGGGGREGSVN